MICVAIGRSRHKHMMAEHQHLAEQGAKMVELRLDYVAGKVNIRRLLAERPEDCQVIITCRRKEDGGKWPGTEEARHAAAARGDRRGRRLRRPGRGRRRRRFRRFGKTKRIISYHNFRKTPDDLRELHARMAALDPDIVKIATMANEPHDNVRMLEMMQESEMPDRRHVHGRHRHAVADSGRQVRGAVHLRHVPPRTDARAGAAQLQADERDLPLRADRRRTRPCTA